MAARDGAGAGASYGCAQGNDIAQGGIGLETLAKAFRYRGLISVVGVSYSKSPAMSRIPYR